MEVINSARSPQSTARSAASGDFEVEYLESESDSEVKPEVQAIAVVQHSLKSPSSTSLLNKGIVLNQDISLKSGCQPKTFKTFILMVKPLKPLFFSEKPLFSGRAGFFSVFRVPRSYKILYFQQCSILSYILSICLFFQGI